MEEMPLGAFPYFPSEQWSNGDLNLSVTTVQPFSPSCMGKQCAEEVVDNRFTHRRSRPKQPRSRQSDKTHPQPQRDISTMVMSNPTSCSLQKRQDPEALLRKQLPWSIMNLLANHYNTMKSFLKLACQNQRSMNSSSTKHRTREQHPSDAPTYFSL